MLTLKAAAAVLSQCASFEDLAAIAHAVGFTSPPMPLDASARAMLGLPASVERASIVGGDGLLRALLIETAPGAGVRDATTRIAAAVTSRAPHMLALLVLRERDGHQLAVAASSRSGRGAVRVASLIADSNRVLDSDAETLCALAAARASTDVLTHIRWIEVLGRDALTRRFYVALRDIVRELGANATGPGERHEHSDIALVYVSRLLFLSFVEAKGWLNGDRGFLVRTFEQCASDGGDYEVRVLRPLFFGTLNTRVTARAPRARRFGRIPFLNGGLFTPTALERRLRACRFGDAHLGRVFAELLGRYRFTAREDSTSWSEAAIDPEMLGKAFESLMAGAERKDSGAFYTPHALVEHVTRSALGAALTSRSLSELDLEAAFRGETLEPKHQQYLLAELDALTVLDPACGSGAFLVHLLAQLANLRQRCGDGRDVASVRRGVLATSIFGVDRNPTAVWLCELRLWLAVLIEADEVDPLRVPPLPNLDHHIRAGDSLLGGDFSSASMSRDNAALAQLRIRYARSTGNRKRILARSLDRAERGFARRNLDQALARIAAERKELLSAQRGVDLFGDKRRPDRSQALMMRDLRSRARELRAERRRLDDGGALPFSFAAHFPDVGARGGFGVVIGNPPWVRLHRIPAAVRPALRREFEVFRNAAWREGAAGAAVSRGFASQVDLAALFAERSIKLLKPGGSAALLLPSKLWRSLAGGGIREFIRRRSSILRVEEWSHDSSLFDAAVYPSLIVVRRCDSPSSDAIVNIAVHDNAGSRGWTSNAGDLGVTPHGGSPFLLLPPEAQRAFHLMRRAGLPLGDSVVGRPTLGVKCGLNAAFIVRVIRTNGSLATIASGDTHGEVERAMLRPALRGADVTSWRPPRITQHLVWTHDATGRPMARLPRNASAWLARWRAELSARSDARVAKRWWALFRTDAAFHDRPRVVWSDFGKTPRATVLAAGDAAVPLNSCYVCRCPSEEDAHALCALLNSDVTAAWLNAIAEPARGGFRRYLGWTVAMLPFPADWAAARKQLAPIAHRARNGEPPPPDTLLRVVINAYGLAVEDVMPLVEWMRR